MLKPRWRKVLVDFWDNKARALLVIASIFIGVFAMGLIIISETVLPSSLMRTYEASNPANIVFELQPFDQNLIDRINRINDVQAVTARKIITVRARVPFKDQWKILNIVVVQHPDEQKIKQLTLLEGRLTPEKNELLLLENALPDFDLRAGEQLEIQLPDDTLRMMSVAGIVKDYSAGIEITINRRIAYVDEKAMAFLHSEEKFTTLYLTIKGDQRNLAQIAQVARQVQTAIEEAGYSVHSKTIRGEHLHPYGNYIDAVAIILRFMGLLVVILSTFLIFNTMNSLMSQQIRQIGVMKLIGARTKDIINMYLVLVLSFGLIAFLIGVPSASAAAVLMNRRISSLLNGELIITGFLPIVPKAILVQIIVSFFLPVCASLFPIVRAAQMSVQQALDNSLIKSEKENTRFDRWLEHIRGVRGIILLAIRNTFRRKTRLALTLFTLSFGGAIFIAVFNVQAVLNQHIETISNYCSADIYVTFNRPYPVTEILSTVRSVAGIKYGEGWYSMIGTLETEDEIEKVYLEAPPDHSQLLGAVVHTGRWVREDESFTIVVNEDFLRTLPDIKPGRTLSLTINGQDHDFLVVGIFNHSGLQNKRAYINANTATLISGSWSSTQSFRLVTEDHSLDGQVVMENYLNQFFRDHGYKVAQVLSLEVIVDEIGEKIDIVITVLLILAILTGLVGSIGLSGALSLNILERTSEIGILRTIGAHNQIIAKLVIFEGLLIGLASYLIAFLLAFPISYILGNLVNLAIFKAQAQIIINPTGFLIWFGLVLVMSIIASLLPARNATQLTIREVLAYE